MPEYVVAPIRPEWAERSFTLIAHILGGVSRNAIKLFFAVLSLFFVYRDGDEAAYQTDLGTAKYKDWRTYKMSDHFPLWVELQTDFGQDYLVKLGQEASGHS